MTSGSTLRFRSSSGTDAWLKAHSDSLTIGVRLSGPAHAARLTFWAALDPRDNDNSLTGLMVGRPHGTRVVGKATRVGSFKPTTGAVCVIAVGHLTATADRDLLSRMAKGFCEAATDEDREAWLSWLWGEVFQGHIKSTYAKRLGANVLGAHAKRFTKSVFEDSMDLVKSLAAVGVFERGADYRLPSGLHAAAYVNLSAACGYPAIVRKLADRVEQIIQENEYNIIVSTGWPVAMIAREVIRMRTVTRLGVVRHSEYEGIQPLPVVPVTKGSRVVVLTDVIVTGRLVERLLQVIKAEGAIVTDVVAIVDASCETQNRDLTFKPVCHYDVQAVAPDSCSRCGQLEPREFNPIACNMTFRKVRPRSPGEFLYENQEAAGFWKQVDAARAYEHHRIEGNTHFISFINTAAC